MCFPVCETPTLARAVTLLMEAIVGETAAPQGSRQIDSEAVSVASSVCAGGACLPRSLRRTSRRGCNVTGSRSTPLLRRAVMHSLQQAGQHPSGAPQAKHRLRRGTKGSHTSN